MTLSERLREGPDGLGPLHPQDLEAADELDRLTAELDIARGLVKDAEDAELEYKERADALEAALQAIVEYNNTMPDDGSWAELMADARSLLEKTNDR